MTTEVKRLYSLAVQEIGPFPNMFGNATTVASVRATDEKDSLGKFSLLLSMSDDGTGV